eukprot:3994959-Pyramimonas_sp.AAC.1
MWHEVQHAVTHCIPCWAPGASRQLTWHTADTVHGPHAASRHVSRQGGHVSWVVARYISCLIPLRDEHPSSLLQDTCMRMHYCSKGVIMTAVVICIVRSVVVRCGRTTRRI